jgi:predicted amidohydrolase
MQAKDESATESTVGRPVRVVSISFPNGKSLDEVAQLVDSEGAAGCDLIVLPETWLGQRNHTAEPLNGATITTMAALARKHHTYIVCPLDRLDKGTGGDKRLNTAVVLDRQGNIAGLYDKVYPYWSEFDLAQPVSVGAHAPVFQTDFGNVGVAICFDVNFPEVWQELAANDAEMVVWPSAYSAGTSLQAHAQINHFYIVTSTQTSDCLVYDVTGEELLYQKTPGLNISRITLDLDRGIYHQNFNMDKRDQLLSDHIDEIVQEKWLDREQWFVLKAAVPGISARVLAHEYGMEELRDYKSRSRRAIDEMRRQQQLEQVIA